MCLLAATLSSAAFAADKINGVLGAPSATVTLDGKQLPPPPIKFGGVIKEAATDSKPWWPPRVVPPKGAPNVLLIMTDDQGYGVSGTFGGVIPTPVARPRRESGIALHAVPFHGAVFADARGADHRPQPSLGRLRRDRRIVDRLSRLRLGHRPREREHRHDPARQRFRDVVVRQEPQHADVSIQRVGPVRPMAVGAGLPVLLRLHGRRNRPVDAVPVPRSHADLSVRRQARLQPHDRSRRRSDQAPARSECGRARPAVLPLLRTRRHALAAPAESRSGSRSSKASSTWATRSCAT